MLNQVVIGAGEMVRAKKSAPVSRQWRRVGSREHQVARAVDERTFALSV